MQPAYDENLLILDLYGLRVLRGDQQAALDRDFDPIVHDSHFVRRDRFHRWRIHCAARREFETCTVRGA